MSAFNLFSPALDGAYHAVSGIAAVLVPLLGGMAPVAAIVLFTALVRLVLHPLARAQVRAEKARAALAPAVEKLRTRYKGDPARIQKEIAALHKKENVPLTAGFLPALGQMPVLFVMYRLFISKSVAGHANGLLAHQLFGVALGSRMAGGGIGDVGVFVVLMAVIAATATWTVVRARKAAKAGTATAGTPVPGAGLIRLLPYGTVVTAAVVPLATGIYLATTTLWTAVERALLTRERR